MTGNADDGKTDAGRARTPEEVRELLTIAAKVPLAWPILVALAAALSTLDVTRGETGHWSFHFALTGITAGFVALAWLPMLIRVIAMAGGGVKTPGGEASVNGLLQASRSASTALAAIEMMGAGEGQQGVAEARALVERQVGALSATERDSRRRLEQIAGDYVDLRRRKGGSWNRTLELEALMQEVGLLADAARLSPSDILGWFGRAPTDPDASGFRVVAMRLMALRPDGRFIDPLMDAIENRRSRFEQYHALRALEAHVDLMDEPAIESVRTRLGRVIDSRQLNDEKRDTSRRQIADRILERLA